MIGKTNAMHSEGNSFPSTFQRVRYWVANSTAWTIQTPSVFYSLEVDHWASIPNDINFPIWAASTSSTNDQSGSTMGIYNQSATGSTQDLFKVCLIKNDDFVESSNYLSNYFGTYYASGVHTGKVTLSNNRRTATYTMLDEGTAGFTATTTQHSSVIDEMHYIHGQRNSDLIYEMRVFDISGNIIARYIPCYRISDHKTGFYEIINGAFFQINGTVGNNINY